MRVRCDLTPAAADTVAVMSTTAMPVLGTTIVEIARPHRGDQPEATPDRITWALTSYRVAPAILMPLTGFFSDCADRRCYRLIGILGFVVLTGLCSLSVSRDRIVVFWLLQAAAVTVPVARPFEPLRVVRCLGPPQRDD